LNDEVATIEDIDKSGTPSSVPAAQSPVGEAPASNPADSAPAIQAETPAVPSQEGPADAPAQTEQEKFHESPAFKRIQRQRANAERRALRAEAELAALRSNPQPQPAAPAKSASEQPKASDFASYDDYVRHQAAEAARQAAREVVTESRQAQAQGEAAAAVKQAKATFEREATKQAEAAGIDFQEAWETLLELPPEDVSDAFAAYLYQAAENKAALVDHFAKNPDEVARISSLHPAAAFKELAKADLQMGVKPKPPTTKAPPPGPTVGGRGVTQKSANDMSMDEFAEHFFAQEEAKLKRA
jgi:hypothetical protein